MTERSWHVASVVPVAFLAVLLGHHPVVALPLLAGVLLPEVDALRGSLHRSWVTHTFLVQTIAFVVGARVGVFDVVPGFLVALHFSTIGTGLHLLADFVYPRAMTHQGAEWPVRPSIGSAPWGLVLLSVSWLVQWYLYLVPSFIPWLFGV